MLANNELDNYLETAQSDGQIDSSGFITITKEQALKKLAEFQLPFENAWAIKVIQSIVAAGASESIEFKSKEGSLVISYGQPGFTIEEFQASFFNPQPPVNRSLGHLLAALWNLGVNQKYIFRITFPKSKEAIAWSGDSLKKIKNPTPLEGTSITITHPRPDLEAEKSDNFLNGYIYSLFKVLRNYCFTCPIPLITDNARIDSIRENIPKGRTRRRGDIFEIPLDSNFIKAELPEIKMPRRVYANDACLPKNPCNGIFYTLDVNLNFCMRMGPRPNNGKPGVVTSEEFVLHWIQDGAVIQTEKLLEASGSCKLVLYANAEGLKTDLTTFNLIENSEKDERLRIIRSALIDNIDASASVIKKTRAYVRRQDRMFEFSGYVALALSAAFILSFILYGSALLTPSTFFILLGVSSIGILLISLKSPFRAGFQDFQTSFTDLSKLLKRDEDMG